jgi:hypothetical protein
VSPWPTVISSVSAVTSSHSRFNDVELEGFSDLSRFLAMPPS